MSMGNNGDAQSPVTTKIGAAAHAALQQRVVSAARDTGACGGLHHDELAARRMRYTSQEPPGPAYPQERFRQKY